MPSAADRTLTQRELNRALLARQMLLDRADVDITGALERMAGLQAQYAPAMYVGLWSRVAGFERHQLTAALESRTVVQGTLLRGTIHLVTAGDYWPFAVAIRQPRREWALRVAKADADEPVATAHRLRQEFAAGKPLHRTDLDRLVDKPLRNIIGMWLDMVRVPPAGTWEHRKANLYGLAEDWLGAPDATVEQGMELLVQRYLAGFGPASRAEIATWAGMGVRDVAPVLSRLELRRFRAPGGTELLDLPDAPLPDGDTPAPVRFLPQWEASLLVHARRSGVLPEEHRAKIFNTGMPQSIGTFTVDGSVAGTWRYEDGRVLTEEFSPLPRAARREVAEEAERLAAFHA